MPAARRASLRPRGRVVQAQTEAPEGMIRASVTAVTMVIEADIDRLSKFENPGRADHSARSEVAGSTRVARRAGAQLARTAMASKSALTALNVSGSAALTSKSVA